MADELLFVFEPEPAGRRAACYNQRTRLQPFVIGLDPNVVRSSLEICHLGVSKARPELLRLLVHVDDELGSVDPLGETGEIFDQRGRGKLSARLAALEHERIQVSSGSINRGR